MALLICLNDLGPKELVLLATEVSLLIADNKTSEELDLLGNFFSSIGQNLNTMAVANFTDSSDC